MTDGDPMLTSRQNPLVKQIRKLHRPRERSRQGLVLLEGTNLLEAALGVSAPLVTVCFTAAWRSRYPQLWQQLQQVQALGTELWQVDEPLLASLTTTPQPDGIIATAPRHPPVQAQLPCDLGVVLETLQDPGNLGTIIRTAAATEVDGLWLSADSVAFDHPKVLRASAGQWFRQPLTVADNLAETVAAARQAGLRIVATQPQTAQRSNPLHWELDWTLPSLILLGNEGAGLSSTLLEQADVRLSIPLAREVESLNVAISLAVILYEAQRQRTAAI